MSTYTDKLAARASADPTRIPIRVDPRAQRISGIAAHGSTPFDVPWMTEIEDGLWQGGCEDGLVLPADIIHVVSLYPWESYTVSHEVQSVFKIALHDSLAQSMDEIDAIASWVNVAREGGPILVHCQAGLNRSSLVVARALMLAGRSAEEAISLIRERRSPACLCNPALEAWLRAFDVPV